MVTQLCHSSHVQWKHFKSRRSSFHSENTCAAHLPSQFPELLSAINLVTNRIITDRNKDQTHEIKTQIKINWNYLLISRMEKKTHGFWILDWSKLAKKTLSMKQEVFLKVYIGYYHGLTILPLGHYTEKWSYIALCLSESTEIFTPTRLLKALKDLGERRADQLRSSSALPQPSAVTNYDFSFSFTPWYDTSNIG